MITGALEFLDGDRTCTAVTGDFLHVPRGVRHRFRNVASQTARMLFLFSPGGVQTIIADHALPAIPGHEARH